MKHVGELKEPPYEKSSARTTSSGILVNNFNRIYYLTYPNLVNVEIARSFIVHEMVHWVSHNHTGFQNTEKGRNQLEWDECVTDYIARNAYFDLYPNSTYRTGYGDGSDIFKKMGEIATNNKNNYTYRHLSTEVQKDLANKEGSITGEMLTWYFQNPSKLDSFLGEKNYKWYFTSGLSDYRPDDRLQTYSS